MIFRRSNKTSDDVFVDRVTGAFNRRRLDLDLAAGVDSSDLTTATLMIEVDDFDQHRDRGSWSADQLLERVAWVVMATVRTSDVVYRHGPSSFCVLLPATADAHAGIVAERVRSNIETMPMLTEANVTVSVGVAIGSGEEVGDTVQRADAALAAATGNTVAQR